MTVTNSNLNISQLSLQSLKEESFSEVPLSEPPKFGAAAGSKKLAVPRRVVSSSHIAQQSNNAHSQSQLLLHQQNSRSSTNIVGLGIRRPSDSIIGELAGVTKKERPFSSCSTASTSSDVSSLDDYNSRGSSITSYTSSPFVSPVIPDPQQQKVERKPLAVNTSTTSINRIKTRNVSIISEVSATEVPTAVATPNQLSPGSKRIYSHSSKKASSSPLLYKNGKSDLKDDDLTPQQKFRLRRSQSKATLREIEKRYDEFGSDDEIADDTFVWNVPMAIGGAASFFANDSNCQSPKLINKVLQSSNQSMPPTELPGRLSRNGAHGAASRTKSTPNLPISPLLKKQASFSQLSPILRDLSSFYDHTSVQYLRNELTQRKSLSNLLPVHVADAQKNGFDDYQTLSSEKLAFFTSTRPTWLPPKSKEEIKKHDKQVFKILNDLGQKNLQKKDLEMKKKARDEVNLKRFDILNEKKVGVNLRSKHVRECGLMLFETDIPSLKLNFNLLTNLSLYKKGLNPPSTYLETYTNDYKDACNKVKTINFTSKTLEFQHITKKIVKNYPIFQDELCDEFKKFDQFLKLNQVSDFEILPFLSSKLIIAGFESSEIYTLLKIFDLVVLTDQFNVKYQTELHQNLILKSKLPSLFLKNDLENLSFKHILSLLPIDIMSRFFKILMLIPDYKLLLALVLTICKDFYFGFNSVKEMVALGKELNTNNIDVDLFFEQLKINYRRF